VVEADLERNALVESIVEHFRQVEKDIDRALATQPSTSSSAPSLLRSSEQPSQGRATRHPTSTVSASDAVARGSEAAKTSEESSADAGGRRSRLKLSGGMDDRADAFDTASGDSTPTRGGSKRYEREGGGSERKKRRGGKKADSSEVVVVESDEGEDLQAHRHSMPSPTPSTPSSVDSTGKKSAIVECPICNISLPSYRINAHLDYHTDSSVTIKEKEHPASPSTEAIRAFYQREPRRTVPVYKIMKDSQLRKWLAKEGLPSHGSKKEMEKRHREFVILFNAQMNAARPMSVRDVVRKVVEEEQNRDRAWDPSAAIVAQQHSAQKQMEKQIAEQRRKAMEKMKSRNGERDDPDWV